ncbi:LysR family transcriptional regulator [Phenylobacterium sp.]|jgi:LysR family glycine cleavage system transcriptional activator|uniref:LysR family transcriptional regulator n=1 Tax=Phenylobacterium sp. TaxID=1871053 RepID=UPI00217986D6|nr:LysR family transcriptional regulator [Phenylobacterium sp.]MCA3259686.1 LysR family transcriptional regulator [Rubrivivax sp.]MCA3722166.1 LysR family transcriptional regulator [Phenylobacterium sp.]MCA3741766.1 LysR family transcriptional regulator [Phenylobacterium sp.]MCA3756401.1 LysR family transcriptional regulator [Phenylobacterium sp.]
MSLVHLIDDRGRGGVPFAALRAFEAAATLGSFKAAGADLGLTASAISHHVRDLEARVGEPLFERRHRSVVLTQAGEQLADALRPAYARIVDAFRRAVSEPVKVRLSAAPLFANDYLLPHVERLRRRLPSLSLQLESSIQSRELEGHNDLIVLRYGPKPSGAVVSRRIAASPLIVVGAPALAAGGELRDLLARGPLLTLARHRNTWRLAFPEITTEAPQVLFDSFEGVIQAAQAGNGLALVPDIVALKALAAGRLCRISPVEIQAGWEYRLIAGKRSAAAALLTPLGDEIAAILADEQVQANR